ncbi:uncharacterized protein [Salminus brasiliensis]|uniref:uncharacterized protein n=1 Tax=Salminus brasiliensis TaxID=930266 RepID=UPI003B837689
MAMVGLFSVLHQRVGGTNFPKWQSPTLAVFNSLSCTISQFHEQKKQKPHTPVMDRYKVLNLFQTVSLLSCLTHGWVVHVPKSVTAVEGSCVTLPCNTSSHTQVVWYVYRRASSPVVYSRKTADIIDKFRGRTSAPGNPELGDCSLKISSIRQEDGGEDLYPWIHPDTKNKYHYVKIHVVKPEATEISVEGSQVQGQLFSANCTVRHSCPSSPPAMEWIGLPPVSYNVTTTKEGELWTSVAQAKFRPNHEDHGKSLSCKSMFSGRAQHSNAHQLNVLYGPKNVTIHGAEGKSVVEGGTVSLTCSGSSRPSPSRYEWLVTQMNFTEKHSSQNLILRDVKRNTSVSCTVYNTVAHGQSEKLMLDVRFPPKILLIPECSELAGGMRCVCRAEAEPRATISWVINGRNASFPHFNTTTNHSLRVTASELTGPLTLNVSCEASNYLGNDHMSVQILPSGDAAFLNGNSNILIIAAGAGVGVVCLILGISVTTICLKKRRKNPSEPTSSWRADSSEELGKTDNVCQENLYINNTQDENLYMNSMEMSATPTEKLLDPTGEPLGLFCYLKFLSPQDVSPKCISMLLFLLFFLPFSRPQTPAMDRNSGNSGQQKVLGIFLSVSLLSCLTHGWVVQVPASVTAVEGSCVTLPCHTSSHTQVVWYMYRATSSPVVYSRKTADIIDRFRGRTSAPGNPELGNCSLKISSVRQEDGGEDLYPWIHPDTKNKYHYVRINVVKPKATEISVEGSQVQGQLFSARCTVRHSCPSSPPAMEWIGLPPVSNGVTTTKEGELWTLVAQAKFRPNHEDHGKSLSCKSMFSGRALHSNAHQLNVLYAPTDVKIKWTEKNMVEGQSVSLTCTSNSNPSPTDYKWLVNKRSSTNQSKSRLDLQHVKRDTSVACIVRNTVGRGQSEEIQLKVHYSPRNVKIEWTEKSVVEGSTVSLTCTSNGNPPPTDYEWLVNEKSSTTTHKATGTFSLQDVRRDTAVSCIAHNSKGQGQSEQILLNVHFPPTILLDSACSEWAGGMQCVCRAEAEPRASVSWRVNGSSALHPHFNTTTNYTGRVAVSELTGPLTHSLSCQASNYLGKDVYQMPTQQPLSGGRILAIVAAVVCVILAILAVMVFRWKRRSHTESSRKSMKQFKTDHLDFNVST